MIFTHNEIEAHVVNFFRAYLSFAETGENPIGFNTEDGLCVCKHRYVDSLERLGEKVDGLTIDIGDYMDEEFINEGMCPDYPFGMRAYLQRYSTHTQHEDPARLQFIRNFIAAKAP